MRDLVQQLINEVDTYDLNFLHEKYLDIKNKADTIKGYGEIKPTFCDEISARNQKNIDEKSEYALTLIKKGYYAVVILAGGLGTRLGYNGPKGIMELEGANKKCLIQLHLEHIMQKCIKLAYLPYVFIMTSSMNDSITREKLKRWNILLIKLNFLLKGILHL